MLASYSCVSYYAWYMAYGFCYLKIVLPALSCWPSERIQKSTICFMLICLISLQKCYWTNCCWMMLILTELIFEGLWSVTVSGKKVCWNWPARISINLQGLCSLDWKVFILFFCSFPCSLFVSISHEGFTMFSILLLSLLVSCFTLNTFVIHKCDI